MDLPAGLVARPLGEVDARAVYELMAAQELADLGEVVIEHADIVADWQRPGTDLAASTVGVFDGDVLVGYGEVSARERGDAAVHPAYRGRGIGTALARWMQIRATALGRRVIGMPVPAGSPGDRLLEDLGYYVRWSSWVLEVPEGARIPDRPLPPRYSVRAAEPVEYEACWAVLEDAFLEWSQREREPFEVWASATVRRPGFEPWRLRVAVDDAGGGVVGAALLVLTDDGTEGFVDRLAVRADQRRRSRARRHALDPQHRLAHRCAVALPEGGNGRHLDVAAPRGGPGGCGPQLTRPARRDQSAGRPAPRQGRWAVTRNSP